VEVNTVFNVELKGNPTTGYSWYLDNVDEIKNSVIEPINLDDNNSGEYIQNKYNRRQLKQSNKNLVGVGGVFVFSFKVKETTSNQLPTLKFIYKRSWESNGNFTTAEVSLMLKDANSDQSITIDDDQSISFDTDGGTKELTVTADTPFNVKLVTIPSTGYYWSIENEEEIKDIIELVKKDYVSNPDREKMIGTGGFSVYTFTVKKAGQLPSIRFIYKRASGSTGNTAILNLKCATEPNPVEVSFKEDGGSQEVTVDVGTSITVKLHGNPTTGSNWNFNNENQLYSVVELVNKDYLQDDSPVRLSGIGGTTIFNFKVKKAGTVSPLEFIYKRSWETNIVSKAEVILKINNILESQENNEFEFPSTTTKGEIKVKDNSTFTIKITGIPSIGYFWNLVNEEELARAGITSIYKEKKPKNSLFNKSGVTLFKFEIDTVQKYLPTIKFRAGLKKLHISVKSAN